MKSSLASTDLWIQFAIFKPLSLRNTSFIVRLFSPEACRETLNQMTVPVPVPVPVALRLVFIKNLRTLSGVFLGQEVYRMRDSMEKS